jgi:hypothetical protein
MTMPSSNSGSSPSSNTPQTEPDWRRRQEDSIRSHYARQRNKALTPDIYSSPLSPLEALFPGPTPVPVAVKGKSRIPVATASNHAPVAAFGGAKPPSSSKELEGFLVAKTRLMNSKLQLYDNVTWMLMDGGIKLARHTYNRPTTMERKYRTQPTFPSCCQGLTDL